MARPVDGGYQCSRCEETKDRSDFYIAKAKNNGLSQYCKACMRTDARARRSGEAPAASRRPHRTDGEASVPLAGLLARLHVVRGELGDARRNLVAEFRKPAPEIASQPIGDVLCWCEGLDEAAAAMILKAAEVNWGRPIRQLAARERALLLLQIKARHPEVWKRWSEPGKQAA
jgi:hypothetical protein